MIVGNNLLMFNIYGFYSFSPGNFDLFKYHFTVANYKSYIKMVM